MRVRVFAPVVGCKCWQGGAIGGNAFPYVFGNAPVAIVAIVMMAAVSASVAIVAIAAMFASVAIVAMRAGFAIGAIVAIVAMFAIAAIVAIGAKKAIVAIGVAVVDRLNKQASRVMYIGGAIAWVYRLRVIGGRVGYCAIVGNVTGRQGFECIDLPCVTPAT